MCEELRSGLVASLLPKYKCEAFQTNGSLPENNFKLHFFGGKLFYKLIIPKIIVLTTD